MPRRRTAAANVPTTALVAIIPTCFLLITVYYEVSYEFDIFNVFTKKFDKFSL